MKNVTNYRKKDKRVELMNVTRISKLKEKGKRRHKESRRNSSDPC